MQKQCTALQHGCEACTYISMYKCMFDFERSLRYNMAARCEAFKYISIYKSECVHERSLRYTPLLTTSTFSRVDQTITLGTPPIELLFLRSR